MVSMEELRVVEMTLATSIEEWSVEGFLQDRRSFIRDTILNDQASVHPIFELVCKAESGEIKSLVFDFANLFSSLENKEIVAQLMRFLVYHFKPFVTSFMHEAWTVKIESTSSASEAQQEAERIMGEYDTFENVPGRKEICMLIMEQYGSEPIFITYEIIRSQDGTAIDLVEIQDFDGANPQAQGRFIGLLQSQNTDEYQA